MAKTKKTNKKKVAKKSVKKVAKKVVKKKTVRQPARAGRVAKKAPEKVVKKKLTKRTTRRTAKKTPVKKTARKKAGKELIVAIGDQCFWIYEGPIVKDLTELTRAFESMQDSQFAHHTFEGNHFADWVEEILADKKCANSLRKARTISESLFVLERALKKYS